MIAKRNKIPEILADEELKKLLSIPNKRYYTGLRNKAMLTLMANIGLRVSEVINLNTKDIDLVKRNLKVVNGKYCKDRLLRIPQEPESVMEILRQWNKKRLKGKYFFNTSKGKQLQVRYIQAMVTRYMKKAKLNKAITPHTFRHTFATNFYRQTKDIETLRKLLGHSDISTTQIYVTLANIDVENAMDSFRGIA